ncbi:hypothetical protein [Bosea sp. (in: a-proteobacteria)]|uniref:hypothetical protein n=1 Tax=Bosea sp. (in: a-proteobacteria) TaxID=1871050 RepID=UPI003B3AC009
MPVRRACYLPDNTAADRIRAHARRLIRTRNLLTVAELAAIALFLRMVWIWAALGAGA